MKYGEFGRVNRKTLIGEEVDNKTIWPETLVNYTKLLDVVFLYNNKVLPRRVDLVLLQLGFFQSDLLRAIDKLKQTWPKGVIKQQRQLGINSLEQLSDLVYRLCLGCNQIQPILILLDDEAYRALKFNIAEQLSIWLQYIPYQTSRSLRRKYIKNLATNKKNLSTKKLNT